MKVATREWIEKAEADWAAATLMRRSRKRFSRDIVCFHLQQCIEKYLKASLEEAAIAFPRTHDLERLLDLAIAVAPHWAALRPAVAAITDFAVEIRYPGRTASMVETKAVMRDATHIRGLLRNHFGLPSRT